jgi:hypothetical protein
MMNGDKNGGDENGIDGEKIPIVRITLLSFLSFY